MNGEAKYKQPIGIALVVLFICARSFSDCRSCANRIVRAPETKHDDANQRAQETVVRWATPFVLGETPPWGDQYKTLLQRIGEQDGGMLCAKESPLRNSGSCDIFLTARDGGIALSMAMPEARLVGEGTPNPPLMKPVGMWRDSNIDGWPDEYAMTDNGQPYGQCFDPGTAIGDGFCRLPQRGQIRDESNAFFGTVAMWFINIQYLMNE